MPFANVIAVVEQHLTFLNIAEPVNALTHFLAALATLVAGGYLLRRSPKVGKERAALFLYLLCLFVLFSMSGHYHAFHPGPWKNIFKHLDYAAIFLVIAGTMSAIQILLLRGMWRLATVGLGWGLALSGMIFMEAYFDNMPFWAIVMSYSILGLTGTLTLARLRQIIGAKRTTLVVAGGAFYLGGAVIDALEWPLLIGGVFGSHEIFHLTVIAGAACHYAFIYTWADLRLAKVRTFLAKGRMRMRQGLPLALHAPSAH
jgi:hemolysin III